MEQSSPNETRIIVQIIPAAPGWRVVYRDEQGIWEEPVVCFALVEERGARHVEPMIPVELGCIDVAPGNSVALAAPGQRVEDVVSREATGQAPKVPEGA